MSKAAGFKRKRDADTTADEKVSKHAKIELDDKQFKEEQFFKPVQAKRNLRLDGKASVCIFDSSGKPVFWYETNYLNAEECKQVQSETEKLPFQDEKSFYGNKPCRQTVWLGEFDYQYSGKFNPKRKRPDWLVKLSNRIAETTNRRFGKSTVHVKYDGVLVNKYRDGNDSISKHPDDEKSLHPLAMITGLNLQTARTLSLFVEKGVVVRILIQPGSLYHFGRRLFHAVEKEPEIQSVRYNFTFREPRSE